MLNTRYPSLFSSSSSMYTSLFSVSPLFLLPLLALHPSAALSRCRPPNLCERATSRLREERKRKGREGGARTTERIAGRWRERKRERAGFASRQTAPGRCKGEGVRSWKISMYPSWRHDVSLNLALRVWSAAPPPG